MLQWVASAGVVSRVRVTTPLHIGVRDGAWAAGPRLVKQAVEAAFDEPGPPLPHRLLGQTDLPGHDGIGLALGATENDPGSQSHKLVGTVYDLGSRGKSGTIRRAEARDLVVNTFRLVDLLQETTELSPLPNVHAQDTAEC